MDHFRRIVRNLLGTDSGLYAKGAEVLDFVSTLRVEGYRTWRDLKSAGDGAEGEPPRPVSLKSLPYPVFLRPGTLDAHVIINNIIRREYGRVEPGADPAWMIDAGAYIGDTSAFFLTRYPGIRIVALEPDAGSYAIAQKNLLPFGDRVTLLPKGLYVHDQTALFSGCGPGASIAATGVAIDCISLPTLMSQYSIPRIDILKMDIEGAEEAIFREQPEQWLGRVGLLILEIHGNHLLAPISRVLTAHGFTMVPYRSVWYCCATDHV
ncbi:MAG TPA: FkbM family methyltransferase [Bacteroidales bacterium]|nr:FkbM family methyltransferase [Bacteroidales bacterium]